jgi:hypothetical protein
MKRALIIIGATCLALALAIAPTSAVTYDSGTARVALVELFTSEGCSSCPPADEWLGAMAGEPGLWRDFVPVALHVDYWDHLGWIDPFATLENSERQRRYSRAWGKDVIYTPGLVLNGREWRTWRRDGVPQSPQGRDGGAAGRLTLTVDGAGATAVFEPPEGPTTKLQVHVAVLGSDLASRVDRGENAGRTLEHDFVAMGVTSETMSFEEGRHTARLDMPAANTCNAGRFAVAAWVSASGDPTPIQAVGGWLEGESYAAETTMTEDNKVADKIIKSDDEWRELLTSEQYDITRQKGTERAFTGEYYDFKGDGLYLCVACGHSLFSSDTKYDSGSGWPSFWESPTRAWAWRGPRCYAAAAAPTWGTFSPTDPSRRGFVTASTRRRSSLSSRTKKPTTKNKRPHVTLRTTGRREATGLPPPFCHIPPKNLY